MSGLSDTEYKHSQMVSALAKPGEAIIETLSPDRAHVWHMVTGLVGEVGELVDALKKHIIYNKTLDFENAIEELGDIEFYLEGIRQGLQITRKETLRRNVEKLSVRYSEGTYSDQQAQVRADKQA